MLRYAPWAMALFLSSIVTASTAHADGHRHVNVFVNVGNRPVFAHPFFHRGFHHPFFHTGFRSTVFVGGPVFAAPAVFAPPPVAFYQPPPFYAPPPPYYYQPPVAAQPPAIPPQGGSGYSTEDCRPYETIITIDGNPQRLVGTVCKGSDGNWHVAP